MSILRRDRLVRLAMALVLATGISVALAANNLGLADFCYVECEGDCIIFVVDCPSCVEHPGQCMITWSDCDCQRGFFCQHSCTSCETWCEG